MKTKKNQIFTPSHKIIAFSLLIAFSTPATPASYPAYPFAYIPPHLTGGSASVPPNVMLLLDTSGSMGSYTSGSSYVTTNECLSPGTEVLLTGNQNPNLEWEGSTCCRDVPEGAPIEHVTESTNTYSCNLTWTLLQDKNNSQWKPFEGYYCQNNSFKNWVGPPTVKVTLQQFVDTDKTPYLSARRDGSKQIVSCKTVVPLQTVRKPVSNPTSETRMTVARNVMQNVITANRNVRWGFATYRNEGNLRKDGANIRVGIDSVDSTDPQGQAHYDKLIKSIKNVLYGGVTPTTSAYYEVLRYYRGMKSGYNAKWDESNTNSPIQYRCQKNFIIYISDGFPNRIDEGSVSGRAVTYLHESGRSYAPLRPAHEESGVFSGAATGLPFAPSDSTLSSVFPQGRGNDPTYACSDYNTCKMYTELGLSHFTEIANTKDLIVGGKDKEGKSFDGTDDKNPEKFKNQTIQTYGIGFGADVPTLKFAAEQGGGQYFLANSADELEQYLKDVLTSINATSAPFSGAAPNATAPTTPGQQINNAMATSLDTESWSSELRFFAINKDGTLDLNQYTTPSYYPNQAKAIISLPNKVVYLRHDSDLENADLGIQSSNTNAWKTLVNWLTRRSNDAISGYRVRDEAKGQRYMGDVLEGNVSSMGLAYRPNYAYSNSTATINNGSTQEFLAIGSNDGMLHVFKRNGKEANSYWDAFQYIPGAAKREPNNTRLAHVLKDTADPTYGNMNEANPITHKYFVNAPTNWVETTTDDDGDSQVILTGALGQGGRAVFALNIAGKGYLHNSSSGLSSSSSKTQVGLDGGDWLKSIPLWDSSTSQFGSSSLQNNIENKLGYVINPPITARFALNGSMVDANNQARTIIAQKVDDLRYVSVFGNGVNAPPVNTSSAPYTYPAPTLFLVDALAINAGGGQGKTTRIPNEKTVSNALLSGSKPGDLIKEIKVRDQNGTSPIGLTAPVLLDINNDEIVDLAYAGDQWGNVYRFDFRAPKEYWNAELIYQGDGSQPITATPTAYYDRTKSDNKRVVVIFGTGSSLYDSDLSNTSQQAIYGVFDDLSDDPRTKDLSSKGFPLSGTSSLIQRKFREEDGNRYLIDAQDLNASHRGWYMNLKNDGERIIRPLALGGDPRTGRASVIFTTMTMTPPEGGSKTVIGCEAPSTNTTSRLMMLDAAGGGRPLAVRLKESDQFLIGYATIGNASGFVISSTSLSATSAYGISGNGKLIPRADTECVADSNNGGKGALYGMIGTDQTGGKLQELFCEMYQQASGRLQMKRLSWREIFDY